MMAWQHVSLFRSERLVKLLVGKAENMTLKRISANLEWDQNDLIIQNWARQMVRPVPLPLA
jgi:hypothetical protein